MQYDLQATPCADVLRRGVCFHPRGVQESFPEDRLLRDMGVESYMGAPLFDSRGRPLGILAVLDGRPLEHTEFAQSMPKIFAVRAAAEMERMRTVAERDLVAPSTEP